MEASFTPPERTRATVAVRIERDEGVPEIHRRRRLRDLLPARFPGLLGARGGTVALAVDRMGAWAVLSCFKYRREDQARF
jgi:hypothetical protein